jgi:hypothetical protein
MAKRLSEGVLRLRGAGAEGQHGREICRNCGGAIIVEGADRDAHTPRRRVCRTCGSEYGTTRASLYPGLGQYSNVSPDFYPNWSDRPRPT